MVCHVTRFHDYFLTTTETLSTGYLDSAGQQQVYNRHEKRHFLPS